MVDILLNRFRIKSVIRTGEWSESQSKKWYESILISLSKKEFQNNRTINLISHPSKTVSSTRERIAARAAESSRGRPSTESYSSYTTLSALCILLQRMKPAIKSILDKTQVVFQEGNSTVDKSFPL